MIKSLLIRNYKSIKELDLTAKRVNILIGEYNSGKSNILEALSWFSTAALDAENFKDIFRFKTGSDFFYDSDTTQPIEIKTDALNFVLRYGQDRTGSITNYLEGIIYSTDSGIDPGEIDNTYNISREFPNAKYLSFTLSFSGEIRITGGILESSFRTYLFKKLESFKNNFRPFLNPPFGENIPSLLASNRKYKELVTAIFKEKGFRLMLKPNEGDINMAKDVNDELYSYPYTSISETLQRIIFYSLAVESNKNATLIFDEPESNTFPMYTKQLAERIALDENSNQYFIATHDPYLLSSLVSKTPMDELAVFVVTMDGYVTKASLVKKEDLSTLLDKGIDVFFNLNKLTDE